MRFVRAVWKLLVGIKDALVLLLDAVVLRRCCGPALKAGPKPIGDGVLLVDLDGSLVEQPARPIGVEPGRRRAAWRASIACATSSRRSTPRPSDDRVKAIALDLERFIGGGQSAIATLGEALDRARRAGKPVLAYATGYSDDSYQLAAHASEIWMNPLGAVAIAGPGGNNLYFKGLFDKLGVTANVYRVGTYKAAVEPYHAQRHVARGARQCAGAGRRDARDVARRRRAARAPPRRARSTPICAIRWRWSAPPGGDFARAALATKLIDRAAERHAFNARLAELGGERRRRRHPLSPASSLRDYVRDLDPASGARADRRGDRRRHDRRRQGRPGHAPAATASPS